MINPDPEPCRTLALLGSYIPRQCGIATFTKDMHDALRANVPAQFQTPVLAMEDCPEGYDYPSEVRFQIQSHRRADYVSAADLLNINNVDLLLLQHEFGIFGGVDGSYILDLTRRLRMPIISTLHTVLNEPSPGQARMLLELAKRSDRLVVMSHLASATLKTIYEVPREKIAVIPHGIPDIPFVDPVFYKDQYGLEGKQVLLTFGLLSQGKGIEYAIRALPKILENHPNVVYVVLGATHPHTLRSEGDAYRFSLARLAEELNVQHAVVFHNRFVSLNELVGFICAADIYLTPYLNKAQIVSGTLAYAAGAGKAVVSTPYWYAEELLADDRGVLVPFKDPVAIADSVIGLLDDEPNRNAMRKRAYMYSRDAVWQEVGRKYAELAEEVLSERQSRPRTVFFFRAKPTVTDILPEVNLAHLRVMTDSTGMYQHAVYSVPDRHHGYCTDDNARALIAVTMHHDLYRDDSVLPLAHTYLSFMHHALNPTTGRFRNFMSFDRSWLEEEGSEDSHGRSIQALGCTVALTTNEALRACAIRMVHSALPPLEQFHHPRTLAFALVGLHQYLSRFPGDSTVRRLRGELATRLMDKFRSVRSDDWPWCEDNVTYDNAKIAHALILSGQWVPDGEMLDQGMRSLEWLANIQTGERNRISLIGNRGWMTRDGQRARFDQQPLEAMGLIEACAEAYRCTRQEIWLDRARSFFGWFLGSNDTQTVLYDFVTGGCRDGLHPDGPNLNQGAESTLAWLIGLTALHRLNRDIEADNAAFESNGHKPRLLQQHPTSSHGESERVEMQ